MIIEAPTREQELSHYFKIMGLLAAAKIDDDVEAVSYLLDDLEMMARFSNCARIRRHAKAEADQVAALLIEMQSKRIGYAGPLVVMTRADIPANLN